MIHERRKVTKIVEELTIFFFSMGGTKMNSGIEYDGVSATITFSSNFLPENRDKVEELERYFNEPKNAGMEDIYWELAGSGDPGESSQLILIGMMIDSHEVHRYGNEVEIVKYKNKELEW